MDKILPLLFICSFQISFASNYYVSSVSGNISNNGTGTGDAWLQLSQLPALVAGDTVFLEAGSLFRESLTFLQGGNSGVNGRIIITSYGNGDKPIISGAEPVNSWTQIGNKYWASMTGICRNFFVNHKEMTLARTPDEGNYYWLDNGTKFQLNDAQLSEPAGFWNGAKICVHNTQWSWEKTSVQNHAAGSLLFTDSLKQNCLNGYGYFFYDKDSCLTTAREWYYDSLAQRIWFIPLGGQNPGSQICEASVRANGIQFSGVASYFTIHSIRFEKQYNAGIAMSNQTRNINIVNCEFFGQYNYGVQTRGKYHEIDNCLFDEVDGIGVEINQGGTTEIKHSRFTNIGQYRNSGIGGETNGSAIKANFADSNYIHHNNIDSAGYCGISADGKYNLVERNLVRHVMLLNNDGAALKSFGVGSQYNIFRNNIVWESNGNKEGTNNGDFDTPGIYFDFNTNKCVIENNTIYNQHPKGIFQNSGSNHNTIRGNVIFGTQTCLDINGGAQTGDTLDNIEVKQNVFFTLNDSAYILRQVNHYNQNSFTQGVLDSNYYFQPFDPNHYVRKAGSPAQTMSFSAWRTYSNQDANTKDAFSNYNTTMLTPELFVNATDNDSTIQLGNSLYLDLDSNIICGNILVPAFYSKILINTGLDCATSLEVNSGAEEKFSVFPIPAENVVHVMGNMSGQKIVLYDLNGKMLKEETLNSNKHEISLTGLSNGFYLIKTGNTVSKIMKQ